RSPVAEEPRLHVGGRERAPQERVVVEVDLPDGEVVRRPPVGVHPVQQVVGEWVGHVLTWHPYRALGKVSAAGCEDAAACRHLPRCRRRWADQSGLQSRTWWPRSRMQAWNACLNFASALKPSLHTIPLLPTRSRDVGASLAVVAEQPAA